MRTILTILLTSSILLALTNSAQARGPRRRIFLGHAAAAMQPAHPPRDARELYPKYYGGFHARALQNIGIPSGDIGIRGNGITANPW